MNVKYLTKCNKRGEGHQMGVFNCINCGKECTDRLTMIKYKQRNNINLYCSIKCSHIYKGTHVPDLFCKECGQKIDNKYSQRTRKFCSRECYDKHQNTQEIRKCAWCGEEYKTQHKSKRLYCSKKCGLASFGETSIEKLMRKELEKNNISFKQYEKIGRFFVDFLLPNKVVVEVDGIYWHNLPENKERDLRKNKLLEEEGYKLFRFTDKEINDDVDGCVKKILGENNG